MPCSSDSVFYDGTFFISSEKSSFMHVFEELFATVLLRNDRSYLIQGISLHLIFYSLLRCAEGFATRPAT